MVELTRPWWRNSVSGHERGAHPAFDDHEDHSQHDRSDQRANRQRRAPTVDPGVHQAEDGQGGRAGHQHGADYVGTLPGCQDRAACSTSRLPRMATAVPAGHVDEEDPVPVQERNHHAAQHQARACSPDGDEGEEAEALMRWRGSGTSKR